MDLKPIIFLFPISETVQKLKDSFSENETVEVFEVDDINEAAQIFQSTAPGIVISSDPKKMIRFQAMNRRIIAETSSKTILITSKILNKKAEMKFSQLGLSDYIKEPIAGKTLAYKINLLVKSLKKKKDPGEDEYSMKEGMAQKEAEELELKGKGDHSADQLDSNMKAKLNQDNDEETEESNISSGTDIIEDNNLSGETNSRDEKLGGFYEGDGEGEMLDLAGNMASEDSEKNDPSFDDMVAKTKGNITEQEEDLKSDIKNESKDLGGHLKGKSETTTSGGNLQADFSSDEGFDIDDIEKELQNISIEEVEPDKKRKELSLENEPEAKDAKQLNTEKEVAKEKKTRELKSQELEEVDKKKKTELVLVDEEIELTESKNKQLEENKKNKKTELNLEEEEDLELALDSEEEKKQTLNNRSNYQEEDKGKSQKGKSSTDQLGSAQMQGKLGNQEEDESADGSYSLDNQLDANELKGKQKKLKDPEEEEKKKKTQLNLEDEDETELDIDKNFNLDQNDKKSKTELDIEDDDQKERQLSKADDIDKYMRSADSKKESAEKEDSKSRQLSSDAEKEKAKKRELKADEFEDNWDLLENENPNEIDESIPSQDTENLNQLDAKALKDKEATNSAKATKREDEVKTDIPPQELGDGGKIVYEGDEDLGEQTIDYKKIKKAYAEGSSGDDAINQNDEGYKADKAGYTFESGAATENDIPKYHRDEQSSLESNIEPDHENSAKIENDEITSLDSENGESNKIEQTGSTIYEADTKGFEFMIARIQDYQNLEKSEQDIFYQICKVIYKEKGGVTTFFINRDNQPHSPNMKLESWFSYHDVLGLDDPEISSQWKELKEKEYSSWLNDKFPKWKDHTFQSNPNCFIFPFYEGTDFHGLGVVTFTSIGEEADSAFIEVQLESARGLYLEQFIEKVSKPENKNIKETVKKKGALNSLFKKAG